MEGEVTVPQEVPVVEETIEQKKTRVIEENLDTPQTFLVRDYQTMTLREIDFDVMKLEDTLKLYDSKKVEVKARIDVLKAKRAEIVTKLTKDIV